MNSPYTYLYFCEFERKVISPKNIKSAEEYLKNLDINYEKPTRDSDKEIYKKSQSDKLNCDPIICLRCRVSMAIYFECKKYL